MADTRRSQQEPSRFSQVGTATPDQGTQCEGSLRPMAEAVLIPIRSSGSCWKVACSTLSILRMISSLLYTIGRRAIVLKGPVPHSQKMAKPPPGLSATGCLVLLTSNRRILLESFRTIAIMASLCSPTASDVWSVYAGLSLRG
jgi:hypothetical protein